MARVGTGAAVLTLLVPALLVPSAGLAQAPDPCADGPDPVWFLAAVYDAELRGDFQAEVDNFEWYLGTLRQTYCILDSRAKILAFDNDYTRNGKTYEPALEKSIRDNLAAYATATASEPDALLFYTQSSHGNVYHPLPFSFCGGVVPALPRVAGSLAFMGRGGGGGASHDGLVYDCDLGNYLSAFAPQVRQVVVIVCSFCGGFSDSLTAVSGTIPDGAANVRSSGVPGPNRIVVTGCAITTECFGILGQGSFLWVYLKRSLQLAGPFADGWTTPGFPQRQGINVPQRSLPRDGQVTMSEWFYATVNLMTLTADIVAAEHQPRLKYGFPDLASDIRIL